MSGLFTFFRESGFVGWVILLKGAVSIGLIIERAKVLFSTYSLNTDEFTSKILNLVMTKKNEEINQNRAFNSEVMITLTEKKAIDFLKTLIKRKANTREEVGLLYRQASLA